MIVMLVVGSFYLFFGLWCTLGYKTTSAFIGYDLKSGALLSEYVTVYGGLEVGLGVAMIASALHPDWRAGGLAFSLIFSIILALWRIGTVVAFSTDTKVLTLAGLETALALVLAVGFVLSLRANA